MPFLGRQFGVATCRRASPPGLMDCRAGAMHACLAGPGGDRSRKGNGAMLAYAAARGEARNSEAMRWCRDYNDVAGPVAQASTAICTLLHSVGE